MCVFHVFRGASQPKSAQVSAPLRGAPWPELTRANLPGLRRSSLVHVMADGRRARSRSASASWHRRRINDLSRITETHAYGAAVCARLVRGERWTISEADAVEWMRELPRALDEDDRQSQPGDQLKSFTLHYVRALAAASRLRGKFKDITDGEHNDDPDGGKPKMPDVLSESPKSSHILVAEEQLHTGEWL